MSDKPKIALYWAASCGGCEIATLNIHEKLLDLAEAVDLFFCPCLVDTKKADVEALPDKSLAITLFNGAIRTSENAEMARLLRDKTQVLVAYGSCATEGCIPGLANFHSPEGFLESIYINNPSVDNPEGILPSPATDVPEGTLELPVIHGRLMPLSSVVEVDYYMPGCPPEPERIWEVLEAILKGSDLGRLGSHIGCGESGGHTTVCRQCARTRTEKKISRLYRTYEIKPDEKQCLLEQGILCMGIATRDGCGALCPEVNMPCTGCYGAPEGAADQGGRMVSALGSILDLGNTKGIEADELNKKIDEILSGVPDLTGTFYKYSAAMSMLKGRIKP